MTGEGVSGPASPKDPRDASGASRKTLREMAARAATGVAMGVATARAARLSPPAQGAGRLMRAGYGFGLPIGILRAVWASPPARRAYLRVVLTQLVMAVLVTAGVVAMSHRGDRSEGGTNFTISAGTFQINVADETAEEVPGGAEEEGASRSVEAKRAPLPGAAADASDAAAADASDAAAAGASDEAAPAAAGVRGWLRARLGAAAAFWSEAFATLVVVEWIIIALSREYHDALSKTASELTGVPPEDTPVKPTVRVNIAWLLKKLKRRIRGALLVALGVPALWVLWLIPSPGRDAQGALLSAWAVYWLIVFTVAKTEHAWSCASPPDPWFLRYGERAAKHRWIRYWMWPWYVRLLRRIGGPLSSPAAHLEKAPYESVGLAAARAITRVPGLYTFFRPLVPVAATHVVVGPGRIESGSGNGSEGGRGDGGGSDDGGGHRDAVPADAAR